EIRSFDKGFLVDLFNILLAVIVANQVLLGRKVLPVRCKGINISATSAAINLCTSHSCIRQQETRLQATLGRLKVFDGIPPPHERRKRMVVPDDGAPEANTEVCFPWPPLLRVLCCKIMTFQKELIRLQGGQRRIQLLKVGQ
uniref:Uncharacterized protein n=1 Tax=Xenopus tropicalis TaxID=8364 RepID=A0A6I8S037_XENTR